MSTLDRDQQQMIGDTDPGAEASQQSWTITPSAAGSPNDLCGL